MSTSAFPQTGVFAPSRHWIIILTSSSLSPAALATGNRGGLATETDIKLDLQVGKVCRAFGMDQPMALALAPLTYAIVQR